MLLLLALIAGAAVCWWMRDCHEFWMVVVALPLLIHLI